MKTLDERFPQLNIIREKSPVPIREILFGAGKLEKSLRVIIHDTINSVSLHHDKGIHFHFSKNTAEDLRDALIVILEED